MNEMLKVTEISSDDDAATGAVHLANDVWASSEDMASVVMFKEGDTGYLMGGKFTGDQVFVNWKQQPF